MKVVHTQTVKMEVCTPNTHHTSGDLMLGVIHTSDDLYTSHSYHEVNEAGYV